jgi:hypothetical protein
VNRATGETLRQQATQEGLVPLKAWVKSALDHVICVCMNEPGLEFVWVGDDAVDPLEQAQTLQILVSAGIKTREEARADLGLAPEGGKGPAASVTGSLVAKRGTTRALLGKFNPHHSRTTGQFTSVDDPDAQATDTPRRELIAEDDGAKTPAGFKLNAKALRRMNARGWTPEEIDEAVKSGNRIDAQNKANGNPATRYVNPTTGKSVVIDNVTNSVVQVG